METPEKFTIDGDESLSMIADLLITVAARQRALEEIMLTDVAHKDLATFSPYYVDTILFHRNEILKSLYEKYASLNEILGKKPD